METLCFEGVKLTCRMEAAREERNRINQPPSPSTNTHTHTQAQWIGFHTGRNIPFCPLRQHMRSSTRSYTSPDVHRGLRGKEGAPNSSGGLPGQLQRGQLLQGVSRAPRIPLWRLS